MPSDDAPTNAPTNAVAADLEQITSTVRTFFAAFIWASRSNQDHVSAVAD